MAIRMHRVRGNRSDWIPKRHVFVDCESQVDADLSTPGKEAQTLRLWAAEHLFRQSKEKYNTLWAFGSMGLSFWDWLQPPFGQPQGLTSGRRLSRLI